ncbi:WD and tetratricopeptide repeats protein 1-like isoform X1 [Limulus polyphemus]|uniref:WD and tetratricopeptide repeats protein 1-like isoform X1 n=1 Tax=Limulus polyphemus TaxID=6850 RepID=A0ABM1BCH9_LIMPO|nr:WD and tetratricopeptide repeats protein 1-like isoform X1 [Limulus polyphemus]XP_022247008.1 WD and tetratricopeptide repeats protein 1-like isoform X1 [Limulus polyphemus]
MDWCKNVVKFCDQRERREQFGTYFQRRLHVTDEFIARLGLEAELEGHGGCVNCLEWNGKGNLLASGSDDVQIIIWDPFRRKKLTTLHTGHHGNIFSVKFLPNSNDGTIASGAGDHKIHTYDVNAKETTMVCSCHSGRVKRLAVAPNVPFMFWSAAEDGLIMQYDLRTPHQCSSVCNSVLINLLNHAGRNAEAKCLAINPLRPELLAVGANDPFVRLYDRRMISPTTINYPPDHSTRSPWERHNYISAHSETEEDNLPPGCATYFVAGHLPLKQTDYRKRYRNLASTFLSFSPDGSELLANLGGEQIYLFNVVKPQKPKTFDLQGFSIPAYGVCKDTCFSSNGYSTYLNGTTNGLTASRVIPDAGHLFSSSTEFSGNLLRDNSKYHRHLSAKAEAIKAKANEKFDKQQYPVAIHLYNEAIYLHPEASILYGNRAAAFMKRGWDGDLYAALRDCHTALKLDPEYFKAHFRLARCLYELHWTREALDCLQVFKNKFPGHAQSHACVALDRDIKAAISSSSETETEDTGCDNKQESHSSTENGMSPRHRKPSLSEQEKTWRASAYDYESRFCGHCNTTTDIKEANFFGSHGQYILAGSDDGSFFIWDRETTNIVRVLRGDDSIVNCLQPHPSHCLLATSGIEFVVRLWSPRPEDGSKEDRVVIDSDDAAVANQKRMNADPLSVMLINMGYPIPIVDNDESEGSRDSAVQCRTS